MITPYKKHITVIREPEGDPHNTIPLKRIIIPETLKHKSRYGHVIQLGSNAKSIASDVKPGDRVIVSWYDGTKVVDTAQGEIEIFHEDEILAVCR